MYKIVLACQEAGVRLLMMSEFPEHMQCTGPCKYGINGRRGPRVAVSVIKPEACSRAAQWQKSLLIFELLVA